LLIDAHRKREYEYKLTIRPKYAKPVSQACMSKIPDKAIIIRSIIKIAQVDCTSDHFSPLKLLIFLRVFFSIQCAVGDNKGTSVV
jgi:hypothetical protein